MKTTKPFKKIPPYWWDMHGEDVIVESDDPKFPVVGRFPFKDGAAELAISQARSLIGDLNAGRKSPVCVEIPPQRQVLTSTLKSK